MKHFLFLLGTFALGSLLSAQPLTHAYVIATEGVPLREDRGRTNRSVTTVPFGGQVLILKDSASSDTSFKGISGRWQIADYGSQRGYVFSAFLSREYRPLPGPKSGLIYLSPCDCGPGIRYQPDWNYYAVQFPEGGLSEVRPVRISFHQESVRDGAGYYIDVDSGGWGAFLVGLPFKLPGNIPAAAVHSVPPMDLERPQGDSAAIQLWGGARLEYRYRKFSLEVEKFDATTGENLGMENVSGEERETWLLNHLAGTEQRLGENRFPHYEFPRLIWSGDLDQDGAVDLLMGEPNVGAQLYLSSWAAESELVGLVAEWTQNHCCGGVGMGK